MKRKRERTKPCKTFRYKSSPPSALTQLRIVWAGNCTFEYRALNPPPLPSGVAPSAFVAHPPPSKVAPSAFVALPPHPSLWGVSKQWPALNPTHNLHPHRHPPASTSTPTPSRPSPTTAISGLRPQRVPGAPAAVGHRVHLLHQRGHPDLVRRPPPPVHAYLVRPCGARAGSCGARHVGVSLAGGGGSIEPPKTGGGREKGSIGRHH